MLVSYQKELHIDGFVVATGSIKTEVMIDLNLKI